MKEHYLQPDWPVPAHVHAYATTRNGGHSKAPYDSFNLADHVGDNPQAVRNNRVQLQETLALPAEPMWLHQVHGNTVIDATNSEPWPDADASYTSEHGVVCVALTADCLPILLCNQQGTQVAAIHAGWKGLQTGVIASTCEALSGSGEQWLAWLGPGISAKAFIVGDDVYEKFAVGNGQMAEVFTALVPGKWQMDLYALARQQLQACGIDAIYGGNYCSYHDSQRFFSYRRGEYTGRMASLIWLG